MKKKYNSLLMLIACFALGSCGYSEKHQKTDTNNTAKEGKELMAASKDMAQREYAEFTDSTESFRKNMQQKMTEWEGKAESVSKELKKDYRAKLNQMKAKQLALDEKIQEYENAASSKKEDLIAEVNQLQSALKKSADVFEQEMQSK